MARVLFLPSYLGGGFGHIGRCLALAEELESRGWETAFALGGQHAGRAQADAPGLPRRQVFALQHPKRPASPPKEAPAFTELLDMNYQLARDGIYHPAVIRACVAEQLGVIRRFHPDLLVADTWPLAGILSHLAGLPLVQITRSIVHPAAPRLIWWRLPPEDLVSPDPGPVFNPLLAQWGILPIEKAEDLLTGDLFLVPSFPELDPLPEGTARTHYVGPLVRRRASAAPAWLEALDPARPLVYVTTGGGAEGVGGRKFYQVLLEALAGLTVEAVVSTGNRLNPHDLPAPPPHVRLVAWAPGPEVIARSRLVVYSGGYGTTMEMVQAGKPGLVIPAHTEQESNARRLEAAGAARVILPGRAPGRLMWHPWPAGRFSTRVYPEFGLEPGDLAREIQAALESQSLAEGARRLQAAAAGYSGKSQAARLVEDLLQGAHDAARSQGWNRLSFWQKLRLQLG